ncbi:MAG: hypothetical protein ABII90_05445 [Bacteroidota bacterium]
MNPLLRIKLVIRVLLIACVLGILFVTLLKTTPVTFNKNMSADREYVSGNDGNEEIHQINEFLSDRSVTEKGSIVNLTFYSKSLKMDRAVQIYLPQGYDQKSTLRYPVIYFLHGAGQNSYSEDQLFLILNTLISGKTISFPLTAWATGLIQSGIAGYCMIALPLLKIYPRKMIWQFISIVANRMKHLPMTLISVLLIRCTNWVYLINFNLIQEATMTDTTGTQPD